MSRQEPLAALFVAKALTVVRFVKALESAMPSEAHSASLDHFRYLQVNVDHNWSWKSHFIRNAYVCMGLLHIHCINPLVTKQGSLVKVVGNVFFSL